MFGLHFECSFVDEIRRLKKDIKVKIAKKNGRNKSNIKLEGFDAY